ncbi:Nucleosomal histone H3-Lys79 methylase [Mortierella sp. NVP85]|nr:Nucleosomal histone H3-Lys79 methylase [Mortierella sp. NVP85]
MQEQDPNLEADPTLSSPISSKVPAASSKNTTSTELTPIKKRRMESILQADIPYSSPSSLSSMSPERSDRTSPEEEPGFNDLTPFSPIHAERHFGPQYPSSRESPEKDMVSQHSLEMELFGVASVDTLKVNEAITGQEIEMASKPRSVAPTRLKDVDEHDSNGYATLGLPAKSKASVSFMKNNNSRFGAQHSTKALKGHREVVVINTVKGTVTLSTPPALSSVQSSQERKLQPSEHLSPSKVFKGDIHKQAITGTSGMEPRRMSILHSDQIVASAMNRYKNHFHMLVEDSDSTVGSNPSSTGADTMHIALEYPGKDSREKFILMKPFLSRSKAETDDKDEYNPIEDLTQTVRIITEHFFSPERSKELFGTPDEGLYRNLTKYKVRKDGAQFMKVVEDFNQIMQKQKVLGTIQEQLRQHGRRLPYDLVVHILQQVYSRTVAARASKLNQYEAFSNNVYGEILPILTKEFIQRTKLDHTKVFVDLGCGIGNVVLQVALQTGAESYGVEIMDTPAKFAKKQAKEFEARSRAFGLKHGQVTMIHGDFLDTPGLPAILARADVVLVNNYAFNSSLNQSLLQLFLDLKEGCKIISLKTFVSLDHKINVRNAGSVESILRVKKYPYYTNAVSWTHNGGEYFIATVDRSAMQAFWANGGAMLDDGTSRRSSTRRR